MQKTTATKVTQTELQLVETLSAATQEHFQMDDRPKHFRKRRRTAEQRKPSFFS